MVTTNFNIIFHLKLPLTEKKLPPSNHQPRLQSYLKGIALHDAIASFVIYITKS